LVANNKFVSVSFDNTNWKAVHSLLLPIHKKDMTALTMSIASPIFKEASASSDKFSLKIEVSQSNEYQVAQNNI
jgi:hypothetical protein